MPGTGGSSENTPFTLSTIPNSPATGKRVISAADAQSERKSLSPFVPLGL